MKSATRKTLSWYLHTLQLAHESVLHTFALSISFIYKGWCEVTRKKDLDSSSQRHHDLFTYACVLSRFSCVRLFGIPRTVARQAPLSIRFSRQEYRSGLPCPPPGALPHPGIEPVAPSSPALQADSLLLSHWGSLYTPHLFHLSMDNHASMPWLS